MNIKLNCILRGLLLTLAGFLCLQASLFKLDIINAEATFLRHNPSQVNREAKGVVQSPNVGTMEHIGALDFGLLGVLLKLPFTSIQGFGK